MGKTIAQLNVEIAAYIKPLQDGLKSAERELRSSGARMSKLGNDISTGLSLPLALLGGAAIQAAGEFESLRLSMRATFQTAGRSIEDADKEVQALKKSALAPGLDFEQAVKASIRLQSVGLSAENARATIEQLANAIASTGGTAENLSSVTVQFAQMISKGKVLAGDLRIVQENLPIVSDLMKKAFGTSNSEDIQKLGISGKEFVDKITAQMGGLARVEGGISNAIVNAGSAVKTSLASMGEELNKTLDITGKIEYFANLIQGLTDSFKNMDPIIKSVVITFAEMALVAGPIFKIYGGIQSLKAGLASFLQVAVDGFKSFSGGVLRAADAFGKLKAAQQATIIGLAIAAVTALYFAYDAYTNSLTQAEEAQKAVNDVAVEAARSTEEEKAKVGSLVSVIQDYNRSTGDREAALNKLKALNPSYFGDLKLEDGYVRGLTQAVESYAQSLVKAANVKFGTEEISKLRAGLIDIGKAGDPTLLQQTTNGLSALAAKTASLLTGGAVGGIFTDGLFEKLNENTKTFNQIDLQSSSDAKIKALEEFVKSNLDLSVVTEDTTKKVKDLGDGMSEAAKKAKLLKEVLSDIANAPSIAEGIGKDADLETIKALESGVRKLVNAGFKPASAEVQNLKAQLDALKGSVVGISIIKKPTTDITGKDLENKGIAPVTSQAAPDALPVIDGVVVSDSDIEASTAAFIKYADSIGYARDLQAELSAKTFDFSTGLDEYASKMFEVGNITASVFASMGSAMQKAASDGATSFKQLGLAAVQAGAKIVRAYIQQGVAAAVAKALSSIPFPFNLVAGAAAGAAAAALFTSLIGKVGVKGFAAGTRDAPGGLALVGERGPELVNLPKHSQVFNAGVTSTALRGGGQNVNLGGEFMVRGTDLVLVLERTQRKNERFR